MGNCQAIDNATLIIQHPCGRVEKLYWPVTASEVMKMNPGHYVALLLSTTTTTTTTNNHHHPVRITRIKLLRPTDTLVLGQVYRLITTQEVMKGLWAKKYAKMKNRQSESGEKPERVKEGPESGLDTTPRRTEMENTNQVIFFLYIHGHPSSSYLFIIAIQSSAPIFICSLTVQTHNSERYRERGIFFSFFWFFFLFKFFTNHC
ncbi:hypothetical protein F0562_023861 [Nyssa sinensis]|uniref:Uncharacterized protein n=1 Tax=Nyssa sinensis TaxID=561372 RepID=A0A5J5BK59_9ASTE|nr:hypothetical protein F0562_023861 [Nyssa sinensis]